MVMRNPIIAALDVPTAEQAIKLGGEIGPAVGAFKIGSELFTAAGPDIVRKIRETGVAVFLDLKFHDIPNPVAKAVASAVRLDVQMLTVHASGGIEMLKAAEKAERTKPLGKNTKGDVEAALKDAKVKHTGYYGIHTISHMCLEPHGSHCEWKGDDKLDAHLSTQNVSGTPGQLAEPLGLDERLREIAGKELKISRKALDEVVRNRNDLIQAARREFVEG